MRIMCAFVSLTIFLALSSGCSAEEEKRKRTKLNAKKAETLRKKAGAEESLKRGKVKVEKLKHTFPALKNILRRLLKPLGLAHLKEEQVRELFKKLMPLIKQMHRFENQINKLEAEADVLMKQGEAEEAAILRLRIILLKYSLGSLDDQVESISATYRKKKRNMRTNP